MSVAPAQRTCAVQLHIAHGFTLLELVVTMAIAVILATLALPSFREIGIRMNVTSTTNDLVGDLNAARVEAVKRGLPVEVKSASDSADWTSGWSINADTTRNGSYTTVIRTHTALPNTYTLAAKASGVGGNDKAVSFGATGALSVVGTSFDFTVCRPAGSKDIIAQSRQITIQGSGEITSHRDVTSSPAGTCS